MRERALPLAIQLPPLHAIVDVEVANQHGWTALDLALACLDGGARVIQLRAKVAASGDFLDLCDAVIARAAPYADARIIVNDRVDLARMCGAAGVHVGQDDLCPAAVRRVLGDDAIVGISTHSTAQVTEVLAMPVSYVAVGPVFGTTTKDTGYPAVGLALVEAAVALCGARPVVAIGGITLERAGSVWRAGATSVAVIGDLLAGNDPAARVADYNRVANRVASGDLEM